jgi:hypothetical protein
MKPGADVPVDLARRRGIRQRGPRELRQLKRLRGVIALVGNADELVTRANAEEYLRRTRQQANDPRTRYSPCASE